MLLALLACAAPPIDTGRTPIEYVSPAITVASAACDPNDPGWTFEVATDAWTGNGQVYLSADGAYVERHPMYTVGAAYDGTSDALRLVLGIAVDFRDVVAGSTTVFNCNAEALTGVLQVFERDGRTVADCRAFGEAPERWKEWSASVACDSVLDTGADTGE